MSIRGYVVALVAAIALAIGCQSRSPLPVSPSSSDPGNTMSIATPGGTPQSAAEHGHTVTLFDACDPETFGALCTGRSGGGITFDNFVAELMKHHSIGAWHMAPGEVMMKVGEVLSAVNRGGEEHTFTEV